VAVVEGAVVVVGSVVVGSEVRDVGATVLALVASVEAAGVGSACEQPAPTARRATSADSRGRGRCGRREVIRSNVASGTIEP
jgi:hypothetical protein